jgi:hypothetical protein
VNGPCRTIIPAQISAFRTETRAGTDLYAFPEPGEADKSILIMNVRPSAVVNPPGSTTREPFASRALYELKIDTFWNGYARN